MYICLYIIFSSILPIFAIINTQKLCVNCKFFVKEFMKDNVYGKCALFTKTDKNVNYLVTGIHDNTDEYYYCSTARTYDDMCGEEGKKYIRRKKFFLDVKTIPRSK